SMSNEKLFTCPLGRVDLIASSWISSLDLVPWILLEVLGAPGGRCSEPLGGCCEPLGRRSEPSGGNFTPRTGGSERPVGRLGIRRPRALDAQTNSGFSFAT